MTRFNTALAETLRLVRVAWIPLLLVGCAVAPPAPPEPEPPAAAETTAPEPAEALPPLPADSRPYQEIMDEGLALFNDRNMAGALHDFRAAAGVKPDSADPWYYQGETLFRLARYDESARAFRRAVELAGVNPVIYTRLWSAELQAGQRDDAGKQAVADEINSLLSTHPGDINAAFAAYEGYKLLRDQQNVHATVELMLQLPGTVDQMKSVANILLQEARSNPDTRQARQWANTYLQRFSGIAGESSAVSLLLDIARKEQQEDAALDLADDVLEPDWDEISTLFTIAQNFLDQGIETERAVRLLERNLAEIDRHLDDDDLAKCPAIELCPLKQTLARHVRYLAQGYGQLNEILAAQNFYRLLMELDETAGEASVQLALFAVSDGDYERAIALLRRALEAGNYQTDPAPILSRLLLSEYEYAGDSAAFFANRDGTVHFIDITQEVGLHGFSGQRVAWGDYDNDGFHDLLLDGKTLIRNMGDGTFRDVSSGMGHGVYPDNNGGLWGDYNNDGLLDLLLTSHEQIYLLKNDGFGGFIDVTRTEIPLLPEAMTEAAAWGDANGDGWLDVYLANYEQSAIERAICAPDFLLLNQPDAAFIEHSSVAGTTTDETLCGRGATWTDINQDGQQDILVSNYRLDPNLLWLNQGNGRFMDNAKALGVRGTDNNGSYGHTIGSVSGDLDNDGDLDIFSANLSHPRLNGLSDHSMLLINVGTATRPDFEDQFADSGIRFAETHSDPALADVDNDGDLDLYITSIYPERPSHLYLNDGKARFTDVSWSSGTRVNNAWGAAFADFDNDGDQDLVIASKDGLRLLQNQTRDKSWIRITVRDRECNVFGVGARVTIQYKNQSQIRELTAGRGTGSQDALEAHFGLGDYQGRIKAQLTTLCGETISKIIPKNNGVAVISPQVSD
jgi:tetratricopeptide (TPR) repeat protein